MTEIKLKNGEIFQVNKEMYLVSDTLGRPSKFPEEMQFKIFIKHIEKHHAGFNIWTNNGVLSIEKPDNYIYTSLNVNELQDGILEIFISALPKLLWEDGDILDTKLLLEIPTDDEEEFWDYIDNEEYPKHILEKMYFRYNDLNFKNVIDYQNDINSWRNRKSILEFREVRKEL